MFLKFITQQMMDFFTNIKLDPRENMGYYNIDYPALDSTTPWYEFLSYLECNKSLNQKPSVNRFVKYNNYFKAHGK
jgi:hypothetical protein